MSRWSPCLSLLAILPGALSPYIGAAHAQVDGLEAPHVADSDSEGDAEADAAVHPDGRLEFAPLVGWIVFDDLMALESSLLFGADFAHHFHIDNPHVGVGAFVTGEGTLTQLVDSDDDIDIIIASIGAMFSYRGLAPFYLGVRMGTGLMIVDGTKSDLPVRARGTFHAGVTLRYFPVRWLVLRADARLLVHDNVQFGAGSGQITNVVHSMFTFGVGVAR